jgi:hypothetical protein
MDKNKSNNQTGNGRINILPALEMLILVVAIVFSVKQFFPSTKKITTTDIRSRAATENLILSMHASSNNLPPNNTVAIMLDARNKHIVFATIKLYFDPYFMQLASDIDINSNFQTAVNKTPAAEANTTGVIYISMALHNPDDHTDVPGAPSGVIELATLKFKSVRSDKNISTNLEFVPEGIQIVDQNDTTTSQPIETHSMSFIINQANVTNTPTPKPTPVDENSPISEDEYQQYQPETEIPTSTPGVRKHFLDSGSSSGTDETASTETLTLTPLETDFIKPLNGDFNSDNCIDLKDAGDLTFNVLRFSKDITYDINADGVINIFDLFAFFNNFGDGCAK